jgi:hypothetical protein
MQVHYFFKEPPYAITNHFLQKFINKGNVEIVCYICVRNSLIY